MDEIEWDIELDLGKEFFVDPESFIARAKDALEIKMREEDVDCEAVSNNGIEGDGPWRACRKEMEDKESELVPGMSS